MTEGWLFNRQTKVWHYVRVLKVRRGQNEGIALCGYSVRFQADDLLPGFNEHPYNCATCASKRLVKIK